MSSVGLETKFYFAGEGQQQFSNLAVSELEDCWGSVVVSCCLQKLVPEAGDGPGTKRKRNVRRWKPLPSKSSEEVTVDTSVSVTVNCKMCE
jgi:hypothetical protein